MTRAEHSSELLWGNPLTGKDETHVGGEPVGFIIEFENGSKLYHMGDTGLFADMKFIGEYYKPDLVLIPIGGHFVMDPRDAAYATREMLKPRRSRSNLERFCVAVAVIVAVPESWLVSGSYERSSE